MWWSSRGSHNGTQIPDGWEVPPPDSWKIPLRERYGADPSDDAPTDYPKSETGGNILLIVAAVMVFVVILFAFMSTAVIVDDANMMTLERLE